jgi:ribonuclease J
MRDLGGEMESEVAYSPKRFPTDDPKAIKVGEYHKVPADGRDFLLTGKVGKDLETFCSECPGSRELVAGDLDEACRCLPFRMKAFDVDHSIFGATAYAIETPGGWLVYTGDLRRHGINGDATDRFVKEAHGLEPEVLLIEGTRIDGTERTVTEKEVHETCRNAVLEETKGLVIADFSPRNFERLDSFAQIARETDRKLVVTPKDAYLLDALKCADGKDWMKGLLVFRAPKAQVDSVEKQVHGKYSSRIIDMDGVKDNPKGFILCFSSYDLTQLLDMKPKGGTYIYSSSEAYSEEQVIDFLRLWNWLERFKFKAKGFQVVGSGDEARPVFEKGFHASGHASSEELIKIIEDINPKKVIPVHTDHPEMFEKLGVDNVELAETGKELWI